MVFSLDKYIIKIAHIKITLQNKITILIMKLK